MIKKSLIKTSSSINRQDGTRLQNGMEIKNRSIKFGTIPQVLPTLSLGRTLFFISGELRLSILIQSGRCQLSVQTQASIIWSISPDLSCLNGQGHEIEFKYFWRKLIFLGLNLLMVLSRPIYIDIDCTVLNIIMAWFCENPRVNFKKSASRLYV
jgi:hypothetical protein